MQSAAPLKQPFVTHLSEVRDRLMWVAASLVLGTVVGYLIHSSFIAFLTKPLNQTLYYSSPAGGFDFILKISLFVGFLLSIPVLVFHLVRFAEPLLPAYSAKHTLLLLTASCVLMVLGVGFAYGVSLPAALHFLEQFGGEQIQSLIAADEYFSFVARYMLGFGLLFQLPLMLLVANSVSQLNTKQLFTQQRWVILVSFVLAAILTPTPDVFNQLLMALPIIVLYQLAVGAVWVVNTRTGRRRRKFQSEQRTN